MCPTLNIDPDPSRACEHCGKLSAVLVEMKPGGDGKSWYLCVDCWTDGVRPWKLGLIGAQYRGDMTVVESTKGVVTTPTGEYPYELHQRRPKDLPSDKPKKAKTKGK